MSVVLDPRGLRLVRARRSGLMTPMELIATRALLEKELEGSGRWLLIGKLLLAGALLLMWMRHYDFTVARLGIFSNHIGPFLLAGLVAGGLLVCVAMIFRKVMNHLPNASKDPLVQPQSRGPASLWLLTFFVGALFEEPWRALCLLSCGDAGWSRYVVVIVSSVFYVLALEAGFPPRISGSNFEDLWAFLAASFLAFLFLRFESVMVPFVASLAYSTLNFAFIRRHTRSSIGVP